MRLHDCDLAIVGSGFGGSVLAMIARRLGLSVMLLERGRHPRFAIGESASPLAGILIEQLADRYDLPRLRPLSAYGTWRATYPDITCGLKRGFTYFHHAPGARYAAAPDRANQLLVAASPSDELSDTHWLRADVDHFLVREAVALGAEYLDDAQVETVAWQPDGSPRLSGRRGGQSFEVRARFLVDASGPGGLLSRALGLPNTGFDGYPATQALFSHFTGVARCDSMPEYATGEQPPYPMDDAALHHVFDEGWMWVLRFDNGVTSAGIAVTDALAAELRLADGAPAWQRFLARYPSIAAQFAESQATREFTWMPRLAWRVPAASGPSWAMLPSAAAFIDPLFSTGIPLTLLGIERLAAMWERGAPGGPLEGRPAGAGKGGPSGQPVGVDAGSSSTLGEYGALTLADAEHAARFVAGCYVAFPRFREFTAYSMFYFAAASYSELSRRLGVQATSARFLRADHHTFGRDTMMLAPSLGAAADADAYARAVAAAIEPLNIAGLADPSKRNWYGVEVADAVRGAAKLGVMESAVVEAMIAVGAMKRM
jgi:FADH2 O2-dependent halogenase